MKVLCQKWEESERNWGPRPDGYSLHLTEEDRQAYIRAYNDGLPKEVPDEYSRPDGTPYWCEVTGKDLATLKRSRRHGIRVHSNKYPGDGGPDGWK